MPFQLKPYVHVFPIAVMSQSAADHNDLEEARRMGRVSLWLNVAGIIISVIAAIIGLIIYFVFLGTFISSVSQFS